MALNHKWDVKNGFSYVLQFFLLISEDLGGVYTVYATEFFKNVHILQSNRTYYKTIVEKWHKVHI